MSLTKKDPSLRVAANDPHLVSLGGGRLSTAVTIHYIPIGDTTIGSSTTCSISLNGTGVRPIHCTIYRSEENEVTIVPEQDARILIDGTKITQDTHLTQGAMITIGNSNYLRFNNPAEAQMMRSAMGSNERISMPQIDFTQVPQGATPQRNSAKSIASSASNGSNGVGIGMTSMMMSNGDDEALRQSLEIETFYETKINPANNAAGSMMSMSSRERTSISSKLYNNMMAPAPIDINGLQCPKVFTADLVTVNMPAKDVLGQKYANFAKNFAENHRANDKTVNNCALKNNQVNNLKTNSGQNSNGPTTGNYVNIPSTSNYIQNTNTPPSNSNEYLTKVNNTTHMRATNAANNQAYDRYPKPGSYGGLQIFPMNGVNTEINNGSAHASPQHPKSSATQSNTSASYEASPSRGGQLLEQPKPQHRNLSNLSSSENERLEDMLKICTEYADRQQQQQQQQSSCNSSITSSPIVQNRIKTNGSLPRDKKSPFHHDLSGSQLQQSFTGSSGNLASNNKSHNNSAISSSSGYENVRLIAAGRSGENRVEISGQMMGTSGNSVASSAASSLVSSPKNGYENVVVGKYVPQSPRTKIRTTCMSPSKKEGHSAFNNSFGQQQPQPTNKQSPPPPNPKPTKLLTGSKHSEYEQLIRTFEEKLQLEMQAIAESSRYQPTTETSSSSTAKRPNKNINNLTLNLHKPSSLQNSPKLSKKPAPAPRNLSKIGSNSSLLSTSLQRLTSSSSSSVTYKRPDEVQIRENGDAAIVDLEQLKKTRKSLLTRIQRLKSDISELQKQEDEVLRELDLERALVSAELNSVGDAVGEFESQLQLLQNKVHRLEAQRNATRVMEENQQAKLKQSIEMKQDQVKKLKAMLKQKPNNDCLKEELHNVCDSLENDRKTFEDLEFQYLEEESEWHAYREELHAEEKGLTLKIEEKRLEWQHLEKQQQTNQSNAHADTKTLKNNLIELLNELQMCQESLKSYETSICEITGQLHVSSSSSANSDNDNEDADDAGEPRSLSSIAARMHSNLHDGGAVDSLSSASGGGGIMSQSLFGSAELLCPKRSTADDIMSKSVNENMFYNNKIELPSAAHAAPTTTSTPKRAQLHAVDMDDINETEKSPKTTGKQQHDATLMRLKSNGVSEESAAERVKFNLSLGSDDFEVNPLDEHRRVPSQDDIDRICKVTLDAPISTQGAASTKIFDSIKEIERNRQLLLAQQGHHVIEHERQKMHDLKKRSHDEARAQYLSMISCSVDSSTAPKLEGTAPLEMQKLGEAEEGERLTAATTTSKDKENCRLSEVAAENSSQQRHSQPEFDTQHHLHTSQHQTHNPPHQQHRQHSRSPRPLSEANSELSCDLLSSEHAKSSIELSSATTTSDDAAANANGAANKRSSSVNSSETNSGGSGGGGNSERKRVLPKHQRPLTRYLPIFSPDLDLRQHIESAGHQIGLCPHVFVDAYSCRGYLHKLGATFHGWARRWFVLDRQRNAFIYYADKSERKPRGGAYFSTIDEVYLDHLNASKSGRPHCTFIVKTKKRSYHLQAASDAAARIWIDAIITGAQGNLDY